MVRLSDSQIKALLKNKSVRESQPKVLTIRKTVPSGSNLEPLKDLFFGKDVYIIGSGLSAYDLDWNWFDGKTTVCINNTIKWFRNPSLHVFLDMPVLQEGGRAQGVPILTKTGNSVDERFGSVYKVRVGRSMNHEPEQGGFYSSYSSTHVSIHVALYLGSKNVYLIGCEQMFYNREQVAELELYMRTNPMYGARLPSIVEQYDKLKSKNRGFGHWYSPWMAHNRDKLENSYKLAGDRMEPFYKYKNVYQLAKIHNTKFPFYEAK